MPALPSNIRSDFETKVSSARIIAEDAAVAALTTLAVVRREFFPAMNENQKQLRRALRARARQLGGGDMDDGMPRLVEEIAYEQWHRMLFARFLAENHLLIHPEGVAVTLAECAELAPEERAEDMWDLATRYASAMLPGIFLIDDPAVNIRFAPEWRHRLEQIVIDLPRLVFTSDDGLGWAYQFWQSKKKDEVNASERKIGGSDIAPVTQLFTEDYMVKFLLQNSLGAWWAARNPDSPLVETFEYLRFKEDGTPAAGTFDGWPDRLAQVTMMDPCGGSGHFVVAGFEMLYRMCMEEEGLSAAEAGDAVIRDNLFMLELDPRCTQIAAFNLALTAWKAGGYRKLPSPNIACSGIPIEGQLEDWLKLAGDDFGVQQTLKRLYHLFKNAPNIGSLINPTLIPVENRMFIQDHEKIRNILTEILKNEQKIDDPSARMFGATVSATAKAAGLLTRRYSLVVTNVPYLQSGKQSETLYKYCEENHPVAKNDLATCFIERCLSFSNDKQSVALVTPQNWLFQPAYEQFRRKLLTQATLNHISKLGPRAFETIGGEIVNVSLVILSQVNPTGLSSFTGLDANDGRTPLEKVATLKSTRLSKIKQLDQLNNPDARVLTNNSETNILLGKYAESLQGVSPADLPHYGRFFWEISNIVPPWNFWQSTVRTTTYYGGRELVIWLNDDFYYAVEKKKAYLRGEKAWGKKGVIVSLMGELAPTLYTGEPTDTNVAILLPYQVENRKAIWKFCSSTEFKSTVRQIDQAIKVTNGTLLKLPFDLEHWQQVAEEQYPNGLPQPYSNDPTQWLFEGHPVDSTDPLQVAVARLLGYRWPEQDDRDEMDAFADEDGIVCLPAVAGESPAHERLRQLLAAAYAPSWTHTIQQKLLKDVGFGSKNLEGWLRDGFFNQHCKLFNNRPFIWHIWDGKKDGFSALVNYHKLDAARLDKLIYTYLGTWINDQKAAQERGEAGADGRLAAALELKEKLELIREGEPPYDIYVRWKELHEQPIGWNPDLNDGVRLNIRPFVTAGVLRRRFTIHWEKDRGKNPDGSERYNDLHRTRAGKEAARQQAGK